MTGEEVMEAAMRAAAPADACDVESAAHTPDEARVRLFVTGTLALLP